MPVFRLTGGGDHRTIARDYDLTWLADRLSFAARTPYTARLLWALADAEADRQLSTLFPHVTRPAALVPPPVLLTARSRLICLTRPGMEERPRAAGFTWDEQWRFWWTQDLRASLALVDLAEPLLASRLQRVSRLPFESLDNIPLSVLAGFDNAGEKLITRAERRNGHKREPPPRLDYDRERGVFTCTDPAHARWSGFEPCGDEWVTHDPAKASTLRQYALPGAELKLQHAAARARAQGALVVPTIPTPPGGIFTDDQLEGIRFIVSRERCLLADEMGVGKTAQAFGALSTLRPRRTLVGCPASLVWNWLAESKLWLAPDLTAAVYRGGGELPATNIVIISYDMLWKTEAVFAEHWDMLALDEAHQLKNERSRRGSRIFGEAAVSATRKVFLTGTPIWNRPQDLWPILHEIAPDIFASRDNFMSLYRINDVQEVSATQQARLDFLAKILRSGLMLRRLKDDALPNLPPKRLELVPVHVSAEVRNAIATTEEAVTRYMGEAKARTLSPLRRREMLKEISRLRLATGRAKLEPLLADVLSFARTGEPFIVFGYHRPLLRELHQRLGDAGVDTELLIGTKTSNVRQRSVDRFQQGGSQGVIGSYDAAAVGLTMTRANIVFLFELDWTEAKVRQAIDRAHRRGQTREVTAKFYAIPGTIDGYIALTLQGKADVASSALGDHLMGTFDASDIAALAA